MIVMNKSFHLYQLQKIDSQVNIALSRIDEIKQLLNEKPELIEAKQEFDNHTEIFQRSKSDLKTIENEVEIQKSKLQECESRLYGGAVQNPKELQDLENEHSMLKKIISDLEEELLEKMIAHEEIQKSLNTVHEKYKEIETNVLTVQALLISEKGNLENYVNKATQEREAQVDQLNASLIEQYEKLRSEKKGVAVANLVDGACSECGTILSPAQRQATKSSADLFYCPSCRRIIYGG